MGLSRRKFTKELKIAALRQMDAGASIAAVARSCETNPNLRGFKHATSSAVQEEGTTQ